MIAGKECTRGCRFCSVETLRNPEPPDPDEPEHLAAAVERMGLAHVVITVVNRDDLRRRRRRHYKRCVEAVHDRLPHVTIELLSSDLAGDESSAAAVAGWHSAFGLRAQCRMRAAARSRSPRPAGIVRAKRRASCKPAKRLRPDLFTKSSIMIGLGETDAEVSDAMQQLRDADVDMLTLGQYLAPGRPGERFLPVDRFVTPEQFEAWSNEARELGFRAVASGPLVRSSFRAGQLLEQARESMIADR